MGVKETFTEVVEKILDTPELWDSQGGSGKGAVGGQRTDGGRGGVPGGVQVVGLSDDAGANAGGCSC